MPLETFFTEAVCLDLSAKPLKSEPSVFRRIGVSFIFPSAIRAEPTSSGVAPSVPNTLSAR